ncbi:MAG TPA: glycoside hydrolase family 30 beta sandwich domain-containing protein [Polyangiaceae bacterium]|nr:glycoside hydrolase family 30 beta sandwich domain-containing protein [Polyangiaceae bacterium]
MSRSLTWITNVTCAFVAVACSTTPNDPHNGVPGSAGSSSSAAGSTSSTGGRGSGNGGALNGSAGGSSAGTPGSSDGGTSAVGAGAGGAPASAAGSPGSTGGASAAAGSTGAAGSAGSAPVSNALVTSASGAFWKTATWTEATGTATVTVNAANTYQTWDGFGGAFNELGWSYLTSKALQDQALQLLFGTDGAHFAWGRIPMGASDYGMDRYTLNENSGDYTMDKFSIERDKQKLIPYIKAALAVRPDIRFWASPWTPPTWMKSSPYQTPGNPVNAFDGGSMKSDDAILKAHALYFVKFIKAYADQGIKIDYVAPQNEPNYSQNYPSAIWSASTFTTFIGKYLGPTLASETPTTQVMLGTMSNPNGDASVASSVLGDATAKGYAKVIGVQWGMSDSGQVNNLKSAGIPIWLSEHKCGGNPGQNVAAAPNDLGYAKDSWGYIRDAMKNGLTAYNAWNMVLDKGGKGIDNTRVWAQNALLVVDGGQITQTPAYYVFRHFSQFVTPKAKRIDATGGDAIAFKNPDGSLVAIMYNSGAANNNYTVSIGGKTLQFAMPGSGWATIRVAP